MLRDVTKSTVQSVIVDLFGSVWSISSIFAASEPGAWYDPSDLSTMFQDSAGTTPVTAVGQPVGLRLDKSKGLVLGPELVTNGDFSNGTTGWTVGTGWTISGGTANTVQPNNLQNIAQARAFPVATYKVQFTVSNYVAGSLTARFSGGGADSGPTVSANGTYTFFITTTGPRTQFDILAAGGNGATATIDNISVKELPGNHASQSTPGSRAIYASVPKGGRRNLLTYSEQFDNAAWLKANGGTGALSTVSANAGVAPDGSTTADLVTISRTTTSGLSFITQRLADDGTQKSRSFYVKAASAGDVGKVLDTWTFDTAVANRTAVTLSADWVRVVLPAVTLSAGSNREQLAIGFLDNGGLSPNTGTVQFLIWGAQLETGSTATNYQRVGSVYDITEAGVQTLYGLLYDGLDDFYVTSTITPGTDKVQVFAGVRKLSDAATGMIVESSTSVGSLNGSLNVAARNAAGYGFASRGTTLANPLSSGALSPRTDVLTGLGDIAADTAILRVNGTQAASSTADQGTGNYLAYPLYIGRRGGTSLPYNGYEFGLIVRFGPNLSTAQIASVEDWLNTRTGAY